MSRGMRRAERLREMERLYVDRGYTDVEMAARLHVNRSTVYKDRLILEAEVPFRELEPGRWKIDRSRYLSAIRVNLHEALALYLAARRASRQTRFADPHVASALEKLAQALRQPMAERLELAAGAVLRQSASPAQVEVREAIAQAWVEQRKVRVAYRSLRARLATEHVLCPYFIEPSLWSDGSYVIGNSDRHSSLITFKLERIERATMTLESFTIPDDFDEQALLRYAWGIWYGDAEPVTVRLRFRPGDAATRLRESVWHPTQVIEELPDGGCVWEARVADWREMLAWVRGWGSDVWIIAPDALRERVVEDARGVVEAAQEDSLLNSIQGGMLNQVEH